jgi:hypothetical protein
MDVYGNNHFSSIENDFESVAEKIIDRVPGRLFFNF